MNPRAAQLEVEPNTKHLSSTGPKSFSVCLPKSLVRAGSTHGRHPDLAAKQSSHMLMDQRPDCQKKSHPGKTAPQRDQTFQPGLARSTQGPRPSGHSTAGRGISRHNNPHITTCLPHRRNLDLPRSRRYTGWSCHSFTTSSHPAPRKLLGSGECDTTSPKGLPLAMAHGGLPRITMSTINTLRGCVSDRVNPSKQPTADNAMMDTCACASIFQEVLIRVPQMTRR